FGEVEGRHARYFAALARKNVAEIVDGTSEIDLARRLRCEIDNLLRAFDRVTQEPNLGAAEDAFALAIALDALLRVHGPASVRLTILERASARLPLPPDHELAIRLLLTRGRLLGQRGLVDRAEADLTRTATAARQTGNGRLEAAALRSRGMVRY